MRNKLLIKSLITIKKIIFMIFVASVLFSQASAKVNVYKENGNVFSKDKLYALSEHNGAYEVILDITGLPIRYERAIHDTSPVDHKMSTMAVGPYGGAKTKNPPSMWYDTWNNSGKKHTWIQLESGTLKRTEHVINWPINARYRDGAEMNQQTGEIYFTADTATHFGIKASCNTGQCSLYGTEYAALAVWDPVTGHLAWNTGFIPLGENLGIDVKSWSSGSDGWAISTDMAIDAHGDMYILARHYRNSSAPGGKRSYIETHHVKLVKVIVPRDSNGRAITKDWEYTVVQDFGINDQLSGVYNPYKSSAYNIFGMVFFNGLLYASYENGGGLFVFNPLDGTIRKGAKPPYNMFDMAAGQLAPIIKGKVYNDTTAYAEKQDFVPLEGITVEILKNGILAGKTITDKEGNYSFMVDSINNMNYSIVIKDPRIDGKVAQQTWASADVNSLNPTRAYCNNHGVVRIRTSPGICRDNVPIRSDVIMTTDEVIAIAEFAITTEEELPPIPIELLPHRINIMKIY